MQNLNRIENQTNLLNFFTWPHFDEDEIAAVRSVLSSGKINYWTGEEGRLFEKEYALSVKTSYAIALMNGTVALEAALAALEIGPGDEVITTCRTFIASASAIVMRGAIPIMADVDPITQNITAESIHKVISPKTKAILVVHIAGWPCEMDNIIALAKEHKLFVIEDCAQAHGATYKNKPVGSLGDVAAFSFCQDKIITTGGEGGMLTTNNRYVWEKVWALKDHGRSFAAVYQRQHPPGFKWLCESFGTNWRMTEIQATIGRLQLKKLPAWIEKRRRHADILTTHFSEIPALQVAIPPVHIHHVFYKYYVFLRPQLLKPEWSRERICEAINAAGVPCYTGICSEIYLEEAFKSANLSLVNRLPIAKQLGETSLMFLVHPTLNEEHMHFTTSIVKDVMSSAMLR